jgi:membrane protease YdiL (CAAX protease family)
MTETAKRDLRHAFIAYAVVAVLVGVFVQIDYEVTLVGHVGSSLVAILLLYAPVAIAWKVRRDEDLSTYGFHLEPRNKGLALGLGVWLVIFPLFAAGYVIFYQVACQAGSSLSQLAPPGMCARFLGWDGAHMLALTDDLGKFAMVQLVVVALPEELFFRGFLHELLERAIPPKRRIWGGGVGWALIISSAMFALIHLPKAGDPRALATFFPGMMFGWMRSATGSILAPTLAHASSNLFVRILDGIFLR